MKKDSKSQLETYVPGPRHKPGWTRIMPKTEGGLYQRFTLTSLGLAGQVWRDLYHSLIAMPWRLFFLGVFAWYLSVNIIFATLFFVAGPQHLEGLRDTHGLSFFLECFFFSVQTLATIGYGRVSPMGFLSNWIVFIEALFGILTAAIITGLLFARFSRPTARVQFSNVALITPMDGLPHLNFRVSNVRGNNVLEANVSVSALKTEFTQEGQRFRNWYDLKLERNHTPVLALTWTIVHPIDQTSPLYGLTSKELASDGVQIFTTIWGVDETLGQTIYSRFIYGASDIIWNAQFSDMLQLGDNQVVVDRSKLHHFERL